MEQGEITVNVGGAPEVGQDPTLRDVQPESSERPWLVRPGTDPEAKFNNKLKCMFLCILGFSLLYDIVVGLLFPLNSRSIWNVTAFLSWPFIPIITDWKTNILLVIFAAFLYGGAFLRRLRKTTGSALPREDDVQIPASIQQV